MSELIVKSGKHAGKRLMLPLLKEVVLGRDSSCQVQLNSQLVSRRHCQLRSTPNGLVITDLESQNGTFVNDVQIQVPFRLRSGDLIRVGAIEFEVAISGLMPAPEVPAKSVSEDDVADWLSDQAIPSTNLESDTTELPAAPSRSETETHEETSSLRAVPKPLSKTALLATDIIRKRWSSREKA